MGLLYLFFLILNYRLMCIRTYCCPFSKPRICTVKYAYPDRDMLNPLNCPITQTSSIRISREIKHHEINEYINE